MYSEITSGFNPLPSQQQPLPSQQQTSSRVEINSSGLWIRGSSHRNIPSTPYVGHQPLPFPLPPSHSRPLLSALPNEVHCPQLNQEQYQSRPQFFAPANPPEHTPLQTAQTQHPRSLPRTSGELEADILSEIEQFSTVAHGSSRGQTRGRGRGTRGDGRTRVGRGRGVKSTSMSRDTQTSSSTEMGNSLNTLSFLPDPLPIPVDELPEDKNPDDPEDPDVYCQRQELESNIMDELKKLPLDDLRRRATKYAKYQRLRPEDRHQLQQAYFSYQREVYLISCKQMLSINPVLSYLGLLSRMRGATSFNNYCMYDDVARLTHTDKSIHPNERARLCGLLWAEVDCKTKEKWKDPDFVALQKTLHNQTEICDQANTAFSAPSLPNSRFKLKEWARDIKNDLRRLSTTNNVEGFFVITTRDPQSNTLITGGSLLGDQFTDMISKKTPNLCNSFFSFVSGWVAIKDLTGVEPSPPVISRKKTIADEKVELYNKGNKRQNIDEVRKLLSKALTNATHGIYTKGWPGTKTNLTLKELGVVLKVKDNTHGVTPQDFCGQPSDMDNNRLKRIICAFGEGWVEFKGPPISQCGEIGGVLENNEGEGTRDLVAESAASKTRKTGGNQRTKNVPGKPKFSNGLSLKKRLIISDTEDEEILQLNNQEEEREKKQREANATGNLFEDSSVDGFDQQYSELNSDYSNNSHLPPEL